MKEKQPSKWKEILLKILYWVGEILTVFSRTQCTFGIKCKMDVRNLDKFVDG